MNKKSRNISVHEKLKEQGVNDYFEKVYREYFRRLYAYALTITRSKTLSQDVVSDVFFNLWASRKELHSIRELKSYLFTSVKNRSISALSDNPVRFHSENYENIIASVDQVDPEELMIGKELKEFINQTIDKLPPQCGLVFRMVKEQQLPYSEVAIQLGVSVDTVKYHQKTALKKLKDELESYFEEAKIIKWAVRVIAALVTFTWLGYTQF